MLCSNFGDYLYHRKYFKKHFEILCSDCNYELAKD